MAGPIASYIQAGDDSGYTGRTSNVRTQTKVIGGNTVHEHMYWPTRQKQTIGVYRACSVQQTVSATVQNGTSTGFFWIHNPGAVSNIYAQIRRVFGTTQQSSTGLMVTAPTIVLTRFTFTGTATGAVVVPDVITDEQIRPRLQIATAVTGLTVTLVGGLATIGVPGVISATSGAFAYNLSQFVMLDQGSAEDEWEVIKPGEGLVMWQNVAGTTADTRKFNFNIVWSEIDVS